MTPTRVTRFEGGEIIGWFEQGTTIVTFTQRPPQKEKGKATAHIAHAVKNRNGHYTPFVKPMEFDVADSGERPEAMAAYIWRFLR